MYDNHFFFQPGQGTVKTCVKVVTGNCYISLLRIKKLTEFCARYSLFLVQIDCRKMKTVSNRLPGWPITAVLELFLKESFNCSQNYVLKMLKDRDILF